MADALFLQILDATVAVLNTERPGDVPEATLRRALPGELLREPRMAVFLGDEQLLPPSTAHSSMDPRTRRNLAVAVQCAASTDDIEELDRITAPMMQWAVQVLGRSRLGGLVNWMREVGTTRRTEYLDLSMVTTTIVFECRYITRRDNLTVRS